MWLPRRVVAGRIAERVAAMVDGGLVDEARRLAARTRLGRTAGQALGYKEVQAHLRGERTLDEAVALAVRRTQSFARRQRVWFRRDPRITWFGTGANPLAVLPALLGEWSAPCRPSG